ncbi:MAG TPA: plastocyanin/azurin family copper-binding protein [Gemmatimonadaceae bacterium]|nr:plastocyanin/azurin family copper-binding protein [Gemmatimonadaceae bacterium]
MTSRRTLIFAALSLALAAAPFVPRAAAPRSHEVIMQGGRFAPFELTIVPGDTVRFVLGGGGPHNVAFRETKGDAAAKLRKRMADTIADLSGPLLVTPGESYVIVFDVPAGRYPYWCIPHLSMGLMGTITVR